MNWEMYDLGRRCLPGAVHGGWKRQILILSSLIRSFCGSGFLRTRKPVATGAQDRCRSSQGLHGYFGNRIDHLLYFISFLRGCGLVAGKFDNAKNVHIQKRLPTKIVAGVPEALVTPCPSSSHITGLGNWLPSIYGNEESREDYECLDVGYLRTTALQ